MLLRKHRLVILVFADILIEKFTKDNSPKKQRISENLSYIYWGNVRELGPRSTSFARGVLRVQKWVRLTKY